LVEIGVLIVFINLKAFKTSKHLDYVISTFKNHDFKNINYQIFMEKCE